MICCRYQPPSACAEWMFALWLIRFITKADHVQIKRAIINCSGKNNCEMCFLSECISPSAKQNRAGYSNFKRLTSSYPTVDRKRLINFDMEHSVATVAEISPLAGEAVCDHKWYQLRTKIDRGSFAIKPANGSAQ